MVNAATWLKLTNNMDLSQITTRELLFNIKNSESKARSKWKNHFEIELPTQVCIKPIADDIGQLPRFQIYLTNDKDNGYNTGFLYILCRF